MKRALTLSQTGVFLEKLAQPRKHFVERRVRGGCIFASQNAAKNVAESGRTDFLTQNAATNLLRRRARVFGSENDLKNVLLRRARRVLVDFFNADNVAN